MGITLLYCQVIHLWKILCNQTCLFGYAPSLTKPDCFFLLYWDRKKGSGNLMLEFLCTDSTESGDCWLVMTSLKEVLILCVWCSYLLQYNFFHLLFPFFSAIISLHIQQLHLSMAVAVNCYTLCVMLVYY